MVRRLLLAALVMCSCGSTQPIGGVDAGGVDEQDSGVIFTDSGVDSGTPDAGVADAGTPDAGVADAGVVDAGLVDAGSSPGDLDGDGLDDASEARLAQDYLPVLGVHPQDGCPLGGIVYRARKHPLDPTLVFIVYVHLFERDCGLTSHVGDNEVFSVTLNPATPAPAGITALRAISHQNTICQRVSTCGTCGGNSACETDNGRPIVYFSKDKHGGYASLSACNTLTCLDQCVVGNRTGVPLVNAGEPNAHLNEDLTDAGFITAANGWTEASVMHFNPWGAPDFAGAGNVADDLTDVAFDTPACR